MAVFAATFLSLEQPYLQAEINNTLEWCLGMPGGSGMVREYPRQGCYWAKPTELLLVPDAAVFETWNPSEVQALCCVSCNSILGMVNPEYAISAPRLLAPP